MQYSHNSCQLSLSNFNSLGFIIPLDNKLVKLSDAIPWDLLIEQVSKLFASEGRNSKSIRMMLGLELAKIFLQTSDEQIVSMLKTDISVMYFCGFNSPVINTPDPSSMTKFRNRLDEKTLQNISELAVQTVIRKLSPRKITQIVSDSTCLPANITYPVDTKLLAAAINKLAPIFTELRSKGKHVINRGKRAIGKLINVFNRKRKKSTGEINRAKEKLISQAKRMIRVVKKYSRKLSNKSKKIIATAEKILDQQIYMYANKIHSVKNRIISFHETELRPIFRGKAHAPTEFGKKVEIVVIGQRIILPTKSSYKNFSDTSMITNDIAIYKKVTGRNPKECSADRGMHSQKNHKLLKKIGCADGIQYRGKIPDGVDKLSKRLANNRSCVEGKYGTLKTRYGLMRIRYKAENTNVAFYLATLVHNFNWYVGN